MTLKFSVIGLSLVSEMPTHVHCHFSFFTPQTISFLLPSLLTDVLNGQHLQSINLRLILITYCSFQPLLKGWSNLLSGGKRG